MMVEHEITDRPVEIGGVFASLTGRRWWAVSALVLGLVLAATVPTAGDLGLTWDEPAYRFSQVRSQEWWGGLARVRSAGGLAALVEPDALLFYWTYARHGINFHPPLAGQLSVLTHAVFGPWMKDIPSRRMASVLEYALTVTLAFGFLSRRYGVVAGGVAAGALLFMPRVYGDGHLATTDTPGLLLWAAASLAFWKGLYEPDARRWRVAVGILLGLAFVEKMAAVFVLVPMVGWLVAARLPRSFDRATGRAAWIDGVATTGAMLLPLAVGLAEIVRLSKLLPPPGRTNLYIDRPASYLPGVVLAVPLAVWVVRRVLARLCRRSPVWGAERPGLETWTAVLAFAPVVSWLGNPTWWRETFTRLAHYYMLNTERRGSLPDIQILYLGRTYEYSLPWHNAWVLIGVTVPVSILAAAAVGLVFALVRARSDRLPLYFLVQFVSLPVARMLPTPAHDGVRLFLPTFFFLAVLAGWGAAWVAGAISRRARGWWAWLPAAAVSALVLVPAGWQLVKVHPFELSYYNELVGGPRGAWAAGFELSYWYDAFNDRTLGDLRERLPRGAVIDFLNDKTESMVILELQSLGLIRPDVVLHWRDNARCPSPYVWLLTQDSKATPFTRLLFAMTPWYARRPAQLGGARVATVADPAATLRAWALSLLTQDPAVRTAPPPEVPGWVRRFAPVLGRFWGEGLTRVAPPGVNESVFALVREQPEVLRSAARTLADRRGDPGTDPSAKRLLGVLRAVPPPDHNPTLTARAVLKDHPEALVEAVEILIRRPDAVRRVLTRSGYTDPADDPSLGGYLDEGVAGVSRSSSKTAPASRSARRQATQATPSVATASTPAAQ